MASSTARPTPRIPSPSQMVQGAVVYRTGAMERGTFQVVGAYETDRSRREERCPACGWDPKNDASDPPVCLVHPRAQRNRGPKL